jgi:hypothetical protein
MENDLDKLIQEVKETSSNSETVVNEAPVITADSVLGSNEKVSEDINSLGIDAGTMDILNQLGVGTSDMLEEVVKSNENNKSSIIIDTNVKEPNIILNKSELIKVIRFAIIMIRKTTNDIESSSINITYTDEGKVLYRLKDNMTYVELEGTCKVSNENPYLKTLSFQVTYLTKLISTAAEDFLLYESNSVDAKGEDKPVVFARVINGDMIVDVFNGNEAKLVSPGTKGSLLKSIPSSTIEVLCDTMTPLVSDTQEVQSKRAILYSDRAFFRSATYLLQYRTDFSSMCLSKKELDLLKLISSMNKTGNIDFYQVDSNGENRILIVAPNIKVSTSVSIPNRDEVTITRFKELEEAKYIKIDKDDFKRVLFLSNLGTNTVAKVTMNYNVDGQGIDAKIIGRDGNSSFNIKGTNYNNLEPRSEDVTIYVPPILTLLKSFETGRDLEIAFITSGVAFRDTTLGIEAIMNYAR